MSNDLLLLRRRMLMQAGGSPTPPTPYDARIEYLASHGSQWIDTGIAPTLDTEVRCTVILNDPRVNVICTDRTSNRGINITYWASGCWATYFGNKGYIPYNLVAPFVYNTPITIIINKDIVKIGENTWTINATSMSGSNLWIFYDCWNQGAASYTPIKELSILNNGVPQWDAYAVRVGTTGYMYDTVSGQLFGNAGTGDFIIGPDIN